MTSDLLSTTYYGNSLGQWMTAFAIIIGVLLGAKIVYWLFKGLFSRMAKKTESKLDDLILDLIEEPIIFCVTVSGIWYGIQTLTLSEQLDHWVNNGIHFLIILAVAWLIARLVEAFFSFYLAPLVEKSETNLDDLLLPIARKSAKTAIWSLGIILALNNAGYNVGALIAGLGIGGIALAMAAKDTVANVFGGFTILTDHPFSLNDRIKIAGFDGTVSEIGIRSTRIRTLAGTLVTIPNSFFAGSAVENVSAEPSRKVVSNLGLTYDTTPEQMKHSIEILKEIAAANGALEEKVIIAFTAFGDFAMNINFIYYIKKDEDIMNVQTEINMAILQQFADANLDFAFPTQTILTKAMG